MYQTGSFLLVHRQRWNITQALHAKASFVATYTSPFYQRHFVCVVIYVALTLVYATSSLPGKHLHDALPV